MTQNIYKWLDKLSDNFRQKVGLWLKEIWNEIYITESWRSPQRQDELYAQWRTTSWEIVTRTTHSNHEDWLAVDIAFRWSELYPQDQSKRKQVATIAQKYWIDWGYDLRGKDKPHFQDNWRLLNNNKNKMPKYINEFNDEVALGYNPLFKNHDGNWNLNEEETKELCEIMAARLERRIKDYIDNKFGNLKKAL